MPITQEEMAQFLVGPGGGRSDTCHPPPNRNPGPLSLPPPVLSPYRTPTFAADKLDEDPNMLSMTRPDRTTWFFGGGREYPVDVTRAQQYRFHEQRRGQQEIMGAMRNMARRGDMGGVRLYMERMKNFNERQALSFFTGEGW